MRSGAILLRVILSLLMGIGFSACPKPGGATVAAGGDVDYYTCTMHPWVHSKKPGTCPVCAMDLVPVYKSKSQGAVVNPFVSQTQRTTKIRIDLPNPDLQLRPGMYVNADLSADLGEGLTVPINAVVPTGSRNIVFLDKGNG